MWRGEGGGQSNTEREKGGAERKRGWGGEGWDGENAVKRRKRGRKRSLKMQFTKIDEVDNLELER